jgi:hypothetical protein
MHNMFTFEGIHIDEESINESLNDVNYHNILLEVAFYIVDSGQGEQMDQFLIEHPNFFNRITFHYILFYL